MNRRLLYVFDIESASRRGHAIYYARRHSFSRRLCFFHLSLLLSFFTFFFFFSSRRRHTRFSRDWSSDVCSSDLVPVRLDRELDRPPHRVAACPIGLASEAARKPRCRGAPLDALHRRRGDGSRRRSEERRVGKECRGGGWRCDVKGEE